MVSRVSEAWKIQGKHLGEGDMSIVSLVGEEVFV